MKFVNAMTRAAFPIPVISCGININEIGELMKIHKIGFRAKAMFEMYNNFTFPNLSENFPIRGENNR